MIKVRKGAPILSPTLYLYKNYLSSISLPVNGIQFNDMKQNSVQITYAYSLDPPKFELVLFIMALHKLLTCYLCHKPVLKNFSASRALI